MSQEADSSMPGIGQARADFDSDGLAASCWLHGDMPCCEVNLLPQEPVPHALYAPSTLLQIICTQDEYVQGGVPHLPQPPIQPAATMPFEGTQSGR